jgi:hypothetical protein
MTYVRRARRPLGPFADGIPGQGNGRNGAGAAIGRQRLTLARPVGETRLGRPASYLQQTLDAGHGMSAEPDRVFVELDGDQAFPPDTAVTGDV